MDTTTIHAGAARFLANLPWTIKPLWQGRSGVLKLDDDRRATITLDDRGHVDHFGGVTVEITSKTNGPITAKWFAFDEYLSKALSDRLDQRADYPLGKNPCFEVIAYCGWEWYIAKPAHPELFTGAVESWIEAWR